MNGDSPRPEATLEPDERAIAILLGVVLLVALGTRLWMAFTVPRFFDDHYIFNNVDSFLDGSLRPRHSYYGSLSYLPQALALSACDLLHERAGVEALAVHGRQVENFTRFAFRLMRMFVIAYSLVSILATYWVGRRLVSPATGLAAAAILAAYPQHLRSSIQLKPDMMALMFTVLTLLWTARAAQSPRLSRYLLAGAGVGLATSAKLIGVGSALPILVWGLWAGLRDRRQWGWLALAGAASVATFFALNPFVGTVIHYGLAAIDFYAGRAVMEGSDRSVVAERELGFLASQHGWFLGACLLLGIAWALPRLRPAARSGERIAALLPLCLCLGYPAAYAIGLTRFRTHNLLLALGGASVVCAIGLLLGARWALRRGASAVPPMRLLVLALPAALLLGRPIHYANGQAATETWVAAGRLLRHRLAPIQSRQVAFEPKGARLVLADGRRYVAKVALPSLTALSHSQLDLMDAEVFPASRTAGPEAPFYRARRRRVSEGCVLEVRPRLFRRRGTPLVLLLHPWEPAGAPRDIPFAVDRSAPALLVAGLPPELAAGDVLSAGIAVPPTNPPRSIRILPGGQSLPLAVAGQRRRKLWLVTRRFAHPAGARAIELRSAPGDDPQAFRLQLSRWTKTACRE